MRGRDVLLWGLLLGIVACSPRSSSQAIDEGARPLVVSTTTMLSDLVEILGGDAVDAQSLLPDGVDPHLYRPVPSDVRKLSRAQLVFSNGLGLEGWLADTIRNARPGGHVVVGSGVEALPVPEGLPDPHFWLDPLLWAEASDRVRDALLSLLPEGEHAGVLARHRAFRARAQALHEWTEERLATVEVSRRVLVTSHDAFGYFARRYTWRVEPIAGLSTEDEASPQDLVRVIRTVQETSVPAIFMESAVQPALLHQVARETGARVAGPLWADSVGPAGSGAETWEGMFVDNVRQIVEALGGEYRPFEHEAQE